MAHPPRNSLRLKGLNNAGEVSTTSFRVVSSTAHAMPSSASKAPIATSNLLPPNCANRLGFINAFDCDSNYAIRSTSNNRQGSVNPFECNFNRKKRSNWLSLPSNFKASDFVVDKTNAPDSNTPSLSISTTFWFSFYLGWLSFI